MILQYNYRWLGVLLLVIVVGAVVLGILAANPPYPLSPQAIARAQTAVAGGTPASLTPTGDTPTNGRDVSLEWLIIAALIGMIVGLVIGINLSRPIIHP